MGRIKNTTPCYCFCCECPITETNASNDHIILNAFGGRRKTKNFSCKSCDNDFGHKWDSVLAKQLNPFSLLLKIVRERKNVPSQVFETTKGEKFAIHSDGHMTLSKPDVKEKQVDDLVTLEINARSSKEIRNILAGFKRKYPNLNIEELMRSAKHQSFSVQDSLKMSVQFGGRDAGKSIVKSALALAVSNGIDPQSCQNALEYLKDDQAEKCWGFFYVKDILLNRPQDKVFHCVAISGNAQTGCLLGYVENFSSQRIVVCLSDSYSGPDVHDIYAIDPIVAEELELSFAIPLSKENLGAIYQNEELPQGVVEQAVTQILCIAYKNKLEDERNNAFTQAFDYGLKKCGWDEEQALTEEQANYFAKCMMEKLQPFFFDQVLKSQRSRLL